VADLLADGEEGEGRVEVHVEDWEMKEVCCEIVGRMKRLWEVERE
jgi:hypothetical protein